MLKKSFALISLTSLLSTSMAMTDLNKKTDYDLSSPKISISFESKIVPEFSYEINAETGKIAVLYENTKSDNIIVYAGVDEKRDFLDDILRKPRVEKLEMVVNGNHLISIYKSKNNEPIICSLPVNHDYEIAIKAVYSNNEERSMSTGIDKSIIDLYKVK